MFLGMLGPVLDKHLHFYGMHDNICEFFNVDLLNICRSGYPWESPVQFYGRGVNVKQENLLLAIELDCCFVSFSEAWTESSYKND